MSRVCHPWPRSSSSADLTEFVDLPNSAPLRSCFRSKWRYRFNLLHISTPSGSYLYSLALASCGPAARVNWGVLHLSSMRPRDRLGGRLFRSLTHGRRFVFATVDDEFPFLSAVISSVRLKSLTAHRSRRLRQDQMSKELRFDRCDLAVQP